MHPSSRTLPLATAFASPDRTVVPQRHAHWQASNQHPRRRWLLRRKCAHVSQTSEYNATLRRRCGEGRRPERDGEQEALTGFLAQLFAEFDGSFRTRAFQRTGYASRSLFAHGRRSAAAHLEVCPFWSRWPLGAQRAVHQEPQMARSCLNQFSSGRTGLLHPVKLWRRHDRSRRRAIPGNACSGQKHPRSATPRIFALPAADFLAFDALARSCLRFHSCS